MNWQLNSAATATALTLAFLVAAAAARSPTEVGARLLGNRISTNADGMHTCAVKEDGTVRCWGFNSAGQLGDGSTRNSASPVLVAGLDRVVSVAVGDFHSCALLVGGNVRCWGANSDGQLGDGSTSQRLAPVAVNQFGGGQLGNVVALVAGNFHTCAVVVDGTARCWGRNVDGQLGTGGSGGREVRSVTVVGLANVVAMAGGATHTCAVLADGGARCWGANARGQLGDATIVSRLAPVAVSGLGNAVAIATGSFHSCAVRADGTTWCWGTNTNGELGLGIADNYRPSPVAVSGISAAVWVAAGGHHSCAQSADGGVQCWGLNTAGQLGDGTVASPRPTRVSVVGLAQTTAITAGNSFTCALDAGETARCWGSNANGALGNDSAIVSSPSPVVVAGGGGSIGGRGIAGGGAHSCAGRASSAMACWGQNFNGQLGDGNQPTDSYLPVTVKKASPSGALFVPNLLGVTAVAAGSDHSCALNAGGAVVCWGDNRFGQLGNGSTAQTQSVSGNAVSGLTNGVGVAAGWFHGCAVQAGGTVQCWGRNSSGQLGNGNTLDRNLPATVLAGVFVSGQLTNIPLSNATAVAAGEEHTCVLSGNGRVACWGSNGRGQLGAPPSTPASNLPVAVAGATNIVAIAAGAVHTCALRATGNVICWGLNFSGQLGDDSTTNRFAPVFVQEARPDGSRLPLNGIVAISAGSFHTCALNSGSSILCWGGNARRQLGDLSSFDRPFASFSNLVLEFVGEGNLPLSSITTLGAGFQHQCALRVNGAPACWGRGTSGQLGSGATTDGVIAATVPSFTFNIEPAVSLNGTGQVARVTALVNCPAGQQMHIEVSLMQGNARGNGQAAGVCEGGLGRYAVAVPSQGFERFAVGPAEATADARVMSQGEATDTEHWTRKVDLAFDGH